LVTLFKIHPVVLPSPWAVWQAGYERREVLLRGAWITSGAALVGFAASVLAGTLIAIVFSQSAKLRTALYPYVIFLQTVPIVAIAPLLIIWSGYNFRTIVFVTMIISVFPIIANVTAGLISIDKNLGDLFALYSASRWQTLTKLRIPAAIPNLVIGMRISCGLAVVGAIIGELFVGSGGAYEGLGTIMTKWQSRNLTAALIAAVLVSTIIGVAFFAGVNLISRTVLRRWTVGANFESER
jgi:NitT/TauT family transport system permease protein